MYRLFLMLLFATVSLIATAQSWIRVNQMGYLVNDKKVAVMVMLEERAVNTFEVINIDTRRSVKLKTVKNIGASSPFKATARLDFSEIPPPGTYIIKVGDVESR